MLRAALGECFVLHTLRIFWMLANGWPRERGEQLIFTLFTSLQVSGILTGKRETEAAGSQYLVSSSDYEKKVW